MPFYSQLLNDAQPGTFPGEMPKLTLIQLLKRLSGFNSNDKLETSCRLWKMPEGSVSALVVRILNTCAWRALEISAYPAQVLSAAHFGKALARDFDPLQPSSDCN